MSGNVKISNTVAVSGNVRPILEDGCNLTVTGSTDGIQLSGEYTSSLTIYGQSNGSGILTSTGKNGTGIGNKGAGVLRDSRDCV